MIGFEHIRKSLAAPGSVASVSGTGLTPAAVALILRATRSDMEILFIERATHEGDPWSGDLGFPGGKVEKEDCSEQSAAERETREEIGLDLSAELFLGRLSDIAGAHLPILVSCFVYGLQTSPLLTLEDEVRGTFWVPLRDLCDPERHCEVPVLFAGKELVRPAIRVLDPGRTVLWGITYRLVLQFLQRLGLSPASPLPRG